MSDLKMYYEKITMDLEEMLYCCITIKWNDTKSYLDISSSRYLRLALHKFGHKTSIKPQHQP